MDLCPDPQKGKSVACLIYLVTVHFLSECKSGNGFVFCFKWTGQIRIGSYTVFRCFQFGLQAIQKSRLIKVSLVLRRANRVQRSIENVYHPLHERLQSRLLVNTLIVPRPSGNWLNYIINIMYMLRRKLDICHVTGDINYLLPFVRARHRILTIHDCNVLHDTVGLKRLLIKIFWYDLPLRMASSIIAITHATKNELVKTFRVNEDRIIVIHNPANYEKFVRTEVQNRSDVIRILHIGTKKNKNLNRLLEAAAELNAEIWVVGEMNDENRRLVTRYSLNVVEFTGVSNEELTELYRKASMLVFASTAEGFGLPIIEAQSQGCPVITSNCSSMPEVAGNGAILVDPNDVNNIREAILEMHSNSDLRNKLVNEGYHNVDRFAPEKITDQYTKLYLNLGASMMSTVHAEYSD